MAREDADSVLIHRGLLEREKLLSATWKPQTDYSSWMDPRMTHHEGLLRPGQRVRMSFSRSHPELNGALAQVIAIGGKEEHGLITVRVAGAGSASGGPKKMRVRPELLLPGRGTGQRSVLAGLRAPAVHGPESPSWRRPASPAFLASAKGTLRPV
mmetsp:Transcript_25617/g.41051  ORF Transcript_25617/g.41051 Transcript_25617/m.41051 type:complete len:155 (+) Transcript_25617:87-551(+)